MGSAPALRRAALQRAALQRAAPVALAVAVGLAGAWAGMALWGRTTTTLGPFRVELASSFGRGHTDIELPPFGRLTADTHRAPLRLRATLQDVEVAKLTSILSEGGLDGLASRVEADALVRLRALAVRVLLAGAAGALLLGAVAFRTDVRRVAIAVIAALVAVGGLQVAALATFRADAFLHPTFSGSLALAPKVIGPVQAATEHIDAFREQLTRVVDGAVGAYTSVQSSPLGRTGEIRVLHISDIHDSPVGYSFAQQIAAGFDVDFVLDTGDVTSFGTPVESLILQNVPAFGRPYVFVRGSHDSMELQSEMARIPNAIVLDGDARTVDGITIYGIGDPVFISTRALPLTADQIAERSRAICPRILADVRALPTPPDIVAVHDVKMAECIAGFVPLVVEGHLHENVATIDRGTLFLQVGTTGGGGPILFNDAGPQPLSAQVLYFRPGSPPELVAYDTIVQNPETGTLTVSRHLVTSQTLEPPASSTPSPPVTPS
ncbi:MAG: metallophosphoesterase [Actinobacteria bacterium]|nr:metallophosphoesterase [Actinomycetota bacterium]